MLVETGQSTRAWHEQFIDLGGNSHLPSGSIRQGGMIEKSRQTREALSATVVGHDEVCPDCKEAYELLDLPPSANEDAIVAACRELAKIVPPDAWSNKGGRFAEIR